MTMTWIYGSIALMAGALIATQVGLNNGLRAKLGHPIPASITSFVVGTLSLVIFGLVSRAPMPAADRWRGGPWWAWLGGVVGAGFITLTVSFSGKLGAAGWLGLVVAGQVIASVVLDHYGLLGFNLHRASPARVFGLVLLLVGALIVLRS